MYGYGGRTLVRECGPGYDTLRKEFELEIQKIEQVFIRFLAKLEVKVERMELKVARLEVEACPGPSSHHGENAH